MKSLTSSLFFLVSLSSFLSYNGVQGLLEGESIIGGVDLDKPHEFPYLVSFENSSLDHWCGGSIIADQFILTAAHCVMSDDVNFRAFPHRIVAGIDDLNAEGTTRVLVEVEKIYVSERYNHSWWYQNQMPLNDWAVLKLVSKLDVVNNPGLKIIDLPQKVNGEYDTYEYELAVLAGFGYDFIDVQFDPKLNEVVETGSSSGRLHKSHVLVVEKSDCALYGLSGFTIDDSQICATFTQDDTGKAGGPCSGDSGSPLVINNTVIGLMTFSTVGCDDTKLPSIYTRISSHVDAIRNAMNDNTEGMRVATAPS